MIDSPRGAERWGGTRYSCSAAPPSGLAEGAAGAGVAAPAGGVGGRIAPPGGVGVADGIEYCGVSRTGGSGGWALAGSPGLASCAPEAESRHGTSNADHGESACGAFGWRRSSGGPGSGAFTGAGGTEAEAGAAETGAGG